MPSEHIQDKVNGLLVFPTARQLWAREVKAMMKRSKLSFDASEKMLRCILHRAKNRGTK